LVQFCTSNFLYIQYSFHNIRYYKTFLSQETAGELGGYEGALENFRRGIYTIRHRIAADAHYLHRGELGAKESKETQLLMMTRVEGIEVVLENQERILAMMGNVLKKQEEPARKRLSKLYNINIHINGN